MKSLELYPVLIYASVGFLMTAVWTAASVERRAMLIISSGLAFSSVVLFFPYYLISVSHFYLLGVKVQLISPLMLLITCFFVASDIKGRQIISAISYILNLAFLLAGLEALKSSGGTWGNFELFFGNYVVFTSLLILQILTYLHKSNFLYGTLKFSFGLISSAIFIIYGLKSGDEYWAGEPEFIARNCVIFISIILIIEGLLLIYKARKEKLTKKKL